MGWVLSGACCARGGGWDGDKGISPLRLYRERARRHIIRYLLQRLHLSMFCGSQVLTRYGRTSMVYIFVATAYLIAIIDLILSSHIVETQ